MKKTYAKPMIVFEDFKMNTSIAADCKNKVYNQSDVNSCHYEVGGLKIFLTDQICMYEPQESGFEALICYDVPTDDTRVFSS